MLAVARDVWVISRDCSCLSRPDRRRSSPCHRNSVKVKSDSLLAERSPVTAVSGGAGKRRERKGIVRHKRSNIAGA